MTSLNWKDIPDWYPYQASDQGEIKSFLSITGPKILKPRYIGNYLYVDLRHNGETYTRSVHSLVLLTYIGERPEGHEGRHLDGDASNNSSSNLCYGTKLENANDKKRHGTSSEGDKNGMSKLLPSQVSEIRSLVDKGYLQREVADMFGITQSHVSNIVNGLKWRDMS